ncbi:MAG: AMP-binding protein [Betaproteobacteria bacterium]|nr:AMP-binding protein [Betaproteobacteria bacterium]
MSVTAPPRTLAREDSARRLLEIVDRLAAESRPGMAPVASLQSSLERDVGLDSLARVELLARVEQAFCVHLPEDTLARAETVGDMLVALQTAGGADTGTLEPVTAQAPLGRVEGVPSGAANLVDVLEWHVAHHPDRLHVLFYRTHDHTEQLTYAGLKAGAIAVAAGLGRRGLEKGQSVAIMLPTCLEFFHCYYGILMAGGVPVPLYPPARMSQIEDHLRRQSGILSSCLAPLLITVPEAKLAARFLEALVDSLQEVVTLSDLWTEGGTPEPIALSAADVAFIQYTSGSTGNPKGVVLTHANLLANIRAWGRAVRFDSSDVVVSWLPLYHDMGLIGAWLGSLYHATLMVLMSPLEFLARPERWLWAIHHHRGTMTAAPNFAYELCLRRLKDEDLKGLDLSSWRLAANGAEPVSPDTIAHFTERFSAYGFRPETMVPVYGLAECTVGLAIPPMGRAPVIDRVQRQPFLESGRAVPAADDDADALRFVACGIPLPGHEARIVDEAGLEVPDRTQGRLEFRGPSATSGYIRNPEETRLLKRGDWLDSGDLAYVARGDIYITSRAKDMIIRGGRNLYPYELEEAVGNLPGVRKGCVAIFGAADARAGTERLVVVAETRERERHKLEALHRSINGLAIELLGTPADDIVLAPPQSVLKTSSGKIRRAGTRDLYAKGALGAPGRAVWMQVARIGLVSLTAELRRIARRVAAYLYAARVYAVFFALVPFAWTATVFSPRRNWAWALDRLAGRALLRGSGLRFSVEGLDNLPRGSACVAVANHASYLDGIAIVAAFPQSFAFVAKRELLQHFIPRLFLRGLGAQFVERFDIDKSVEDSARLSRLGQDGESLFFFPEGTLTRVPGLMAFRMGAFLVAAEAGIPVLPISLVGTRSVLRDGSWFPRRGELKVVIGKPIFPSGADWNAAVALRDKARAEILQLCGEPDLAR